MTFRRWVARRRAVSISAAIFCLLLSGRQAAAVPQSFGIIVKFKANSTAALAPSTSLTSQLLASHKVVGNSGDAILLDSNQAQNFSAAVGNDTDPCAGLHDLTEYCEPNYEVTIDKTPSDPSYSSLWALDSQGQATIGAPEAWDMTTGSEDSIVAVLDTGIDYNHPDLAANVWTNPGEVPGNGIDDDGDGYIDDVHGVNAASGTGDPYDDNVHGTHVSGTIGAVGNNGVGVVGVNWKVKILGIKFMDSNGAGTTFDAIKGIDYAVNLKLKHGVNILAINSSWGGSFYSKALEDAVGRANSAGILFVAASGNAALNLDQENYYPASYKIPNVISVASIDQYGNMSSFSNYGRNSVDLAAPGGSILSTAPGGGYIRFSGTSMAAPHVTGAIALLNAWQPGLDAQTIKQRILSGVSELASVTPLVKTGGILNLPNALKGIPGNSSVPGGDSSNPPPSQATASLKSSHRTLTAAHDYSFVVSASAGSVVKTRFVLNNKSCNLKSVRSSGKRVSVSLRVPPSPLAGDISLEAVDPAGTVEYVVALKLRPDTRRRSRSANRAASIKLNRASARVRDAWCQVAKKTLRVRVIK
jgi:serine protease